MTPGRCRTQPSVLPGGYRHSHKVRVSYARRRTAKQSLVNISHGARPDIGRVRPKEFIANL
jgi:hypothetical protein